MVEVEQTQMTAKVGTLTMESCWCVADTNPGDPGSSFTADRNSTSVDVWFIQEFATRYSGAGPVDLTATKTGDSGGDVNSLNPGTIYAPAGSLIVVSAASDDNNGINWAGGFGYVEAFDTPSSSGSDITLAAAYKETTADGDHALPVISLAASQPDRIMYHAAVFGPPAEVGSAAGWGVLLTGA